MQATALSKAEAMPLALKWGMAFLAFYTVNMLHFPQSFGVPGLNVLNVICIAVWAMHLQTGCRNDDKAPVRVQIFLLFGIVTYAFLLTQITLPLRFMLDLTFYKAAIFYPLYFFLFFYVVRTEDDIRFMMFVILTVAIIAGYEAVREGLDFGVTSFNPMKRASGPFGKDVFTANRAGVFYAMFFALALACVLHNPQPGNRWIRPFAALGVVVLAAGIFYTFSRQSYLIVALVSVLMMLKRGPFLWVVLIVLGLSYSYWLPDAAVSRLADTEQVDEDGVETVDGSTESRWIQWEAGGKMLGDHPWGVGFQRFAYLSESYGGKKNLDAHNHYVLFAVEASPVGLIIHLVLVFSLLNLGRRLANLAKKRQDPLGRTLGTAFTFVTLAMIFGNVYGSPFANGEVMGLYWGLGGLAARHFLNLQRPNAPAAAHAAGEPAPKPPQRKRPRRRGRDLPAPAVHAAVSDQQAGAD
ncbi:MAG: O-antigen ligase family protein [Alphaproteobacteria bacterium]